MLDTLNAMANALRSVPIYGGRVELRRWGENNPPPGIYYAGRADPSPGGQREAREWSIQWAALVVSPPDEMIGAQYSAQCAMIDALESADECGAWAIEPDTIETPPLGANTGTASITVKFVIRRNAL